MFTGDAVLSIDHIRNRAGKIKGACTIHAIEEGMHDLMLSKKPVREKVYDILFDWLSRVGSIKSRN